MISSHRVYISGHPFFVETEFFNSNSRYHSLSRFEIRSGIPPLSTAIRKRAVECWLKPNSHRAGSFVIVKIAAHIVGAVVLLIGLLYWACILLPKPYWPFVCPWSHSMKAFGYWMILGVI